MFGRLYISDQGDAITPDGYCQQLTKVIVDVVFKRFDRKDQMKALRRIREFTSFVMTKGERWDAFLHEPEGDTEKRMRLLLASLGCKLEKVAFDGTTKVTHPSATYLRVLLVTIRQFYRELCGARLHHPDNPMDVTGWRTMSIPQRERWAKARNYHPIYGMEHAGHRFFANVTPPKPRMLYSPYEAADALSHAVDGIGAPAAVVQIKEVQRVNGLRFSDFAFATAHGYALAGLEDHFRCRNKQGGDDLSKSASMPSGVQAAVRRRFEAAPHPHDHARSLWDRIVELAPRLALGGQASIAAADELKGYNLFVREDDGDTISYDAYRYWLRKAALAGGVVVQTNHGPWFPTSIVFRKAAIAAAVKALFARTTSSDGSIDREARQEGLDEICDRFYQSTDQTKVYADWEYELEARRTTIRMAERREQQQAAERSMGESPLRSQRLSASVQRRLDRLAQRPEEAVR
ncbi:hypothetical protein PQ455_13410 [Sphingomonas naphthae]|uniref:Uncharacterized protein n=1 Tax=Sphingomonas naphthae TaxID=1813468 RepID=A0ABY7TJN7_9SPHN|nr:hypothetical protein [Sphingomonas naphthae]WCT72625.1 hypothetical protein PQ455_13410 [Sphingomonas naphthae]